jgi:hypothetical protein
MRCSRFGPVKNVQLSEMSVAQVVFFDIRSAACAMKILGNGVCKPVASKLCRSVRLSGTIQLESRDVAGVANVSQDESDTSAYTVEFFDARDAERYQKMVTEECLFNQKAPSPMQAPPGLSIDFPPGLELPPSAAFSDRSADSTPKARANDVAAPPGLGLPPLQAGRLMSTFDKDKASPMASTTASTTATPELTFQAPPKVEKKEVQNIPAPPEHVEVRIQGLPNNMLSEMMMRTMLQQAGVSSAVVQIQTKKGKPCGEAIVNLSDPVSALACAKHFHGCKWDVSGTVINAMIRMPLAPLGMPFMQPNLAMGQTAPPAEQPQEKGAAPVGDFRRAAFGPDAPSGLRAHAPAFVPNASKSAKESPVGDFRRAVQRSSKNKSSSGNNNPRMCADAPAFVPAASSRQTRASAEKARASADESMANVASSDASTDVGIVSDDEGVAVVTA